MASGITEQKCQTCIAYREKEGEEGPTDREEPCGSGPDRGGARGANIQLIH